MKTRTFTSAAAPANEFSDYELQTTLRDFLQEEEKQKSSVWNIATIAGLAMFFVSMLYVLQLIGLVSGVDGWMTVLPIVGAALIAFVGFGYFVGDRKHVKRIRKKQKAKRKEYFESEFASQEHSDETFSFENDLFDKETSHFSKKASKKEGNPFKTSHFDRYALGHSKKLYKSRTNKKLAGVCGGLARYFGFGTNFIRFLFVVTTIAGVGASVFIYIALALVLDKEPTGQMVADDFNF